jgi:hypothetical protein
VFNSGATAIDCQYEIVSRNGAQWEEGYGYFSAATTFARRRITANSSGTTSAISLATGTKDLMFHPISGGVVAALPKVTTLATTRLTIPPYPYTYGTLQTLVADKIYYCPFQVYFDDAVDAVVFKVETSNAGNVICGIYSFLPSTGGPGNKLATGSVVTISSTGLKVSSFTSVKLPVGWYYLALNMDSTAGGGTYAFTSTVQGTQNISGPLGLSSGGYAITGFYESQVYDGTLPAAASASPSVSDLNANRAPYLQLRCG